MSKMFLLGIAGFVIISVGVFYKFKRCSCKCSAGEVEATPTYLYKVLSVKGWEESQQGAILKPGPIDTDFIHLAKEDQLEKVITKFWSDSSEYVVVKLDPKKFIGKLVYEFNPGGSLKYYHLYNGSIPFSAVIDAKHVIRQEP